MEMKDKSCVIIVRLITHVCHDYLQSIVQQCRKMYAKISKIVSDL